MKQCFIAASINLDTKYKLFDLNVPIASYYIALFVHSLKLTESLLMILDDSS